MLKTEKLRGKNCDAIDTRASGSRVSDAVRKIRPDAPSQERRIERRGGRGDCEGEIDRLAGRSFSLSERRDRARSLINDNGVGSLFLSLFLSSMCMRETMRPARNAITF